MAPPQNDHQSMTRRALLKHLGVAPLLLRPALFHESLLSALPAELPASAPAFPFSEYRLTPRYPARSPLEDVLRLVAPGFDEYAEERSALEVGLVLARWSQAFRSGDLSSLANSFDPAIEASLLVPVKETHLRTGALRCSRREFPAATSPGAERFLESLHGWIGHDARVETAEFEITSIEEMDGNPLTLQLEIRYAIVAAQKDGSREERIGSWKTRWNAQQSSPSDSTYDSAASVGLASRDWRVSRVEAASETVAVTSQPKFVDVSRQALGGTQSWAAQMLYGSDHWRTVLDGACGIDVYGNNGVAVGDFDNDGWDDLYVSQPAGLPNRFYRNRGDGSFEDVTEKAGVGVLDNTACALFADFRNIGLQDLLVVCGSGPMLFLNRGDGSFAIKPDAFHFAQPPLGTFTHAAIADYDRDGRLDIYFCVYSYYLGLDQYHYPAPYFDARNGPPNFLFHNEGDGSFVDRTEAAGLNNENNRYSFACAWGESLADNRPDLYVANDFGRNSFYRNHGDGTFTLASTEARVEDVGAGMSACWTDVDNDGRPDLYAANMWSAAGQRVSGQDRFQEKAPADIREFYRRHARGNALYRNQDRGVFENVSQEAGVEMGRWAWCSDFWDFDHDGYLDLYVTNGYISAPGSSAQRQPDGSQSDPGDLGSFFWRQVVAKSPNDSSPSTAYEHGWNALNELIRSDNSWSGRERNVMYANNRDGTFTEVSGITGLDFLEDSRSFALADLDHDGRLEVVLKNRSAPQLRVLHNAMQDLGDSLCFRLQGTTSNRDAIGTAITLEAGSLHQTRYLQAGSGFLAQHSKEVFFGLGKADGAIRATVRWPGGLTQVFEALPRNSRISIKEGVPAFTATRFIAAPSSYARASSSPAQAVAANVPGPADACVETWLIDPLQAPSFSLPDLGGASQTLESHRGQPVLLCFWSHAAPGSEEQLKRLHQHRAAFAAAGLTILPVNVDAAVPGDPSESLSRAHAFATQQRLAFPMLFATEETAGIYNIIYRYLFDRRRNLPLPTSFLLDSEGRIVKVYQGAMEPPQVMQDARSIPANNVERMQKALPFAGTLYQGAFARNDFTYGVAMFQHGYLEQAAASFQQVVAAKPDSAEGFYNLGTLSLRRNHLPEARQYLEQALKLKPGYPEAWNNLGMMAAQQGNLVEAIGNFQQSLSLRPTYATALLNLGNAYRRQKDFPNAQRCLNRVLELEPGDAEANYSLGMFYAQQDQLEPASTYLEKALSLRPGYPEALNNLGVLSVRRQEYEKAERQFRTCIRVAPQFDQSYINLARLYVLQHDKEKATRALNDLLQVEPESAAAKQGLEVLRSMP